MSQNPYQTPSIEYHSDRSPSPLFVLVRSLGPAVISVGLMILFWMTFALVFGLLRVSVPAYMITTIWVMSLLICMGTSTVLVTFVWKSRSTPLAFGLAYATFAIVFYILVVFPIDDVERAFVIIATLAALPFISSGIVWCVRRLDRMAIDSTRKEDPH